MMNKEIVSAAFNERALVPNQACNVFERMFVVMKDRAAWPRLLLIRCCCFNKSRHMDGDSCNELTQPTQLKQLTKGNFVPPADTAALFCL